MEMVWLPGHAQLAAERAALRRAAGTRQEGDDASSTARSRRTCGGAATTCRHRPSTRQPRAPAQRPRYARLPPDVLPATECLRDVVVRVLPYWFDTIVPQIGAGLDVLVIAHGNSLRALMMHLERITADEIAEINIPTGAPRLYRFDSDLHVTSRRLPRRPCASSRRARPPSPRSRASDRRVRRRRPTATRRRRASALPPAQQAPQSHYSPASWPARRHTSSTCATSRCSSRSRRRTSRRSRRRATRCRCRPAR